jgi:hypothetical protein
MLMMSIFSMLALTIFLMLMVSIFSSRSHYFLIFFIFGTSGLFRRGAIPVLVTGPSYKIAVALVRTRGADCRRALGFCRKADGLKIQSDQGLKPSVSAAVVGKATCVNVVARCTYVTTTTTDYQTNTNL